MTLDTAHDAAIGPARRPADDPQPFDYANPIVIDPAHLPSSLDLYCIGPGQFTFLIKAGSSGTFHSSPVQFTTQSGAPIAWPGDFNPPQPQGSGHHGFTMYNNCSVAATYWFKLKVLVGGVMTLVDPSIDNHPPSNDGGDA